MAKGDSRKAAHKWLLQQGIIENLDDDQFREVQKLIGNPSFGIFWGMLRWQREASAIALSNASLGTPSGDAQASVLQGMIRQVDATLEVILKIAEPTFDEADAASENEEHNNERR